MATERRHVESIATLINQGKTILFVGEGVSTGTQLKRCLSLGGEEVSQFISLNDLARLLCQELSLPKTSLEQSAERFERRRGRVTLNELLWSLFRDLEPRPVHHLIARLGFKLIYTTNYDALLETAFQQELGFYPVVVARNTDVALVHEHNTIVKLHGDIAQADTIIITETDYADYPRDRKALFDILRADLYAHSFIFLGYGLRDDSLRTLYRSMVSSLGRFVNLSYAVLPPDEFDPEAESIWRDNYKIQLLGCDIEEFIAELCDAVAQNQHKNQQEERQRRVESARQHFESVAENSDRAILAYSGSSQDLEDLVSRLRNEYSEKNSPFAYVNLKSTGPFKGRAGLFKYVLETLSHELQASVREVYGVTSDYELDFSEYERRAQSEKYRYLYLRHGERADLMLQGKEPIPNQAHAQEIGEETFVRAAMEDFVILLKYITDKVGWHRIVLFLDRLDIVEQFLPTLQQELFQQVIETNKNVLFVISHAGPETPKWEGYGFEDRHVQCHEL
jgi:hypothetical protein